MHVTLSRVKVALTFCSLRCVEMAAAEGSNSSKQDGSGEGAVKKAKEGSAVTIIVVAILSHCDILELSYRIFIAIIPVRA